MSVYNPVIKKRCPNCNKTMYSEGIHNGVGYIYPPFYCDNCGWSERCAYEGVDCKKCDQYERCFNLEAKEDK